MKEDSIIDKDFSFYIHITWWEVVLLILVITAVIYLFRKNRRRI